MLVKAGKTDVSVELFIADDETGAPLTGLAYNSSGIDLKYRRNGAAATSITEATLSALTDAHADGGFLEIGHGWYRLDLPDAACASSAVSCLVFGTITGGVVYGPTIQLVAFDPENAMRLGLTALPNAAADAAGGLPISDAGGLDLDAKIGALTFTVGGKVDANVTHAAGTAWASGAITAAVLASDAITAAKLHSDVTTELQSGLATLAAIKVPGSRFVSKSGNDSNDGSSWAAADLTLAAAKAAASAGDTIFVGPGTYDEKNLAKNGVNWHFLPGAKVISTAATAGGIWDDTSTGANGAASYRVSGQGYFEIASSGASNADVVRVGNSASRVAIEAQAIIGDNRGVVGLGGDILLDVDLVQSSDGAIDNVGASYITGRVQEIRGSGLLFECDNAAAYTDIAFGTAITSGDNATGGSEGVLVLREGLLESTSASSAVTVLSEGVEIRLHGVSVKSADGQLDIETIDPNVLADAGTLYDPAKISGTIIALKTDVAAVLADTNELQTDWANGGRLDLILDETALDASNTADEIVNIAATSAKLNDTLEDDGGTYRFTTNALEEAPSGTGASASEIADAVWDEAQSGHTTAGTFGKYVDAAISGVSTGGVSAADIADAVWDESTSGHTSAGTFGEQLKTDVDAILVDTAEIGAAGAGLTVLATAANLSTAQTAINDIPTNSELATALAAADDAVLAAIAALNNLSQANVRAAVGLASANLDTQLDALPTAAELAAALGSADDATLAAIAALNNISAADVNAQVVDVIRTDTTAELSAVPAASPNLHAMIQWLYMASRNKIDVTADALEVHNDAGTAIGTKSLSDDGTTYSEGKAS